MNVAIFSLSLAFAASPLLAQNATPAATPSPALEAAASTPTATPAASKKKHGLSISISDDEDSPEADAKSKLTPDQEFQLKLARAQNPSHDELDAIGVPLGFFVMVFAIVALTLWARVRRNRLMHETVRLFAEKGQPLPPEIFHGTTPPAKPKSDLRRGIFWIAVGLGLIGYFVTSHDSGGGFGFVPLFIGLGYLLAWKLEKPPKPGTGA